MPYTLAASLRPLRLLPITLMFALTACGSCDGDETNKDTPDQAITPDMPDETMDDMSVDMPDPVDMPEPVDMPPVEEDMPPDMPDPVDMGAPIPPGPEVTPVTFSMYPPIPVSCDNPGEGGRYRIPVAVIAEEEETGMRRPMRPFDRIAGRPLVINNTVNVGAIAAERIRVSQESGASCTTSADCDAGFVCATGGDRNASNVCLRQTGLSFVPDSIEVSYDPGGTGKKQLVTVLYENSGGLVGLTPREVGELFDDAGEKDLFKVNERATDSATISRTAMEQFFLFLASFIDLENSSVSAWWFAGDKSIETVPLTRAQDNARNEDHFTTNLEEPVSLIGNIPDPSARLGTGNVYQAIMRVIDKDLGLDKYDDHEKFLFVVVDGPNEVWDAEATRENVLAKLQEHNVHTYFIHFDTAIDADLLRDPLSYWAGSKTCRDDDTCSGANPCATNADCQNFEECRTVTLYGETANAGTSQTPLNYCVPNYRDDGRLGPINAYADMACRTGGNYLYFTNPRSLEPSLKELPAALDGQWTYEAVINSLDPERATSGFYRLSGVFLGLFGNSSLGAKLTTDIFEPCFNDPMNDCLTIPDNRPLMRLGTIE